MKKIELDSLIGLGVNFLILILFFVTFGGTSFILFFLPIITIPIEIITLVKKDINVWLKIISKLLLLLSPTLILFSMLSSYTGLGQDYTRINLLWFCIIIIQLFSIVYIRIFKRKNEEETL